MKKVVLNYLVIAALAVAAALTSCGGSGSGGFGNAKWEYMVFDHSIDQYAREELNKKLNELGEQGWELVSSGTGYMNGGSQSSNVLYLKRKL